MAFDFPGASWQHAESLQAGGQADDRISGFVWVDRATYPEPLLLAHRMMEAGWAFFMLDAHGDSRLTEISKIGLRGFPEWWDVDR